MAWVGDKRYDLGKGKSMLRMGWEGRQVWPGREVGLGARASRALT